VTLISRLRAYATSDVPFSDQQVPLVAENRAKVSVRLDHPLVERVIAPETLDLPVQQGDRVGKILVYDGEKVVARRALVSTMTLSDPSVFTRARWYAGRALDEAGDMLSSLSPF
jgi:hypothetical protein